MIRAIIVLTTTFLFGLFGLLVGYLNVQAAERVSSDLLLASYGAAPFGGLVLGFIMSAVALMLFAPGDKR